MSSAGNPAAARLSQAVRAELYRLCELAYPLEACGALFGQGDGEQAPWHITRVRPAHNQHGDDQRRRYLVAPDFQASAEREARHAGEQVLGYYHSHPDGPALPSHFDREHAWPGYLYVICSVVKARAADMTLFALAGPVGPFCQVRAEPALPFNPEVP